MRNKRIIALPVLATALAPLLSGCGVVDSKTANLSIIYVVTAVLAAAVLLCYCLFAKKKYVWHLLLFSAVLVVNLGYLWLSFSDTLGMALWANRLAYLGSVFLPFSMFMITLNTIKVKCNPFVVASLLCVGVLVFLVAASPGYLNVYYKSVELVVVNGFATLDKEYGPLHIIYLLYLVGYFLAMLCAIVYAYRKNSAESKMHTVILTMAVFVNIGVWFIEQLVSIDFELLSISYIISELFLLGLDMLIKEYSKLKPQPQLETALPTVSASAPISKERLQAYRAGVAELTKTERLVYDAYVDGKSTKEVLLLLNIKENTLKFHNKNIYMKLGVSSRKQLIEIAKAL